MSESAQVTAALSAATSAAVSHIAGQDNQIGLLTIGLTKSNAERDAALEENEELKARIAELEGSAPPDPDPPPDPTPAAKVMLIGVNGTGPIPDCPSPPMIRRLFYGTLFAKQALPAGVRGLHVSFKDTSPTQARVDAFLDGVAASQMQGTNHLYVTSHHEQERGDKGFTPAQVQATQKATILCVRDWKRRHPDRPNVYPSMVFMGWYERDAASANTSTADYWPTDIDLSDVVLGLDPYDPLSKQTAQTLIQPSLTLWRAHGGKRWCVAEINTKRTGQAASDWWNAAFAWIEKEGGETCDLFLHNSAGKDAPWTTDAGATFDAAIKARTG